MNLKAPFPWFGVNAARETIWFSPNCLRNTLFTHNQHSFSEEKDLIDDTSGLIIP